MTERARRRPWLAGLAAAALALSACGGDPTGLEAGSAPQFAGGPGAAGAARTLDPALVGSWSRTLLFADDVGFVIATETRWTFRADGAAERRVVTSNLALDLADQIVSFGEWSTDRGTLVVRLGPGAGDVLRAPYRVEARLDGARLLLDGLAYLRLSP